ncbi:MAG: SDR family oxidoreductase [Thermoanaerobaculia bacterium]|nr:SDR family oxidoreductase [Thermoanaerobaculia bacterium]
MTTAVYPSLRDRVVLVTGGANGIGACLVRRFVAQGSRVAFLDIDEASAETVVADAARGNGPAPLFLRTDLTRIAELRAAVVEVERRLGAVRVLVNNAAADDRHDWAAIEPDDWDRLMAVNLRHQFFAAQAVATGMAAAGGGAIVNFGSISALRPVDDLAVYAAAKAAVLGLTRALARELGPRDIRVNAVTPGWTMTPRQQRWATPEALAEARRRQCLKVAIDPDAVASVALFLAADDSRMCTAAEFVVDAGSA